MILMTSNKILRNSCIIGNGKQSHLVATLDSRNRDELQLAVVEQFFNKKIANADFTIAG